MGELPHDKRNQAANVADLTVIVICLALLGLLVVRVIDQYVHLF